MRILLLCFLIACGGHKKAAIAPQGGVSPLRESVSDDVAVRHRRVNTSWRDIVSISDDDAGGGGSTPAPAQPLASPEQKQPEKLVVEAWLELETENVGAAVDAIRARIE